MLYFSSFSLCFLCSSYAFQTFSFFSRLWFRKAKRKVGKRRQDKWCSVVFCVSSRLLLISSFIAASQCFTSFLYSCFYGSGRLRTKVEEGDIRKSCGLLCCVLSSLLILFFLFCASGSQSLKFLNELALIFLSS